MPLELVDSARSVRHTAPVAISVWPLDPSVRTERRESSAATIAPAPESEPKRPHSEAPQPRSSREKTCHVSPMAIESVCSACTALSPRSSGPELKRRTKPRPGGRQRKGTRCSGVRVSPEWSKAVKSAASEAASSSTRGSGGAPSGPASRPGSAELPRATRRALRRRRRRAGALPRGHFGHAVSRKKRKTSGTSRPSSVAEAAYGSRMCRATSWPPSSMPRA
eukprot:scaffold7125_cov54-Phaeocystis_antarctica.AAC.4